MQQQPEILSVACGLHSAKFSNARLVFNQLGQAAAIFFE